MPLTWLQVRKAVIERWYHLKKHIQKEAGQNLTGPELVIFAIGLAGQKLLDDIAQIHTLTNQAINLVLKCVLVIGVLGIAIILLFYGL